MSGTIDKLLLVAGFLLLAGCASVDFDYPKPESSVIVDTADTLLGRALADAVASQPERHPGFIPTSDAIAAPAIRLLLADR